MGSDDGKNRDWRFAAVLIAFTSIAVLAIVILLIVLPSMDSNPLDKGQQNHTMKVMITGGDVSDSTLSSTLNVLQERFDLFGYNVTMNTVQEQGNASVLICYGNIS
jgi:hypothetical protein